MKGKMASRPRPIVCPTDKGDKQIFILNSKFFFYVAVKRWNRRRISLAPNESPEGVSQIMYLYLSFPSAPKDPNYEDDDMHLLPDPLFSLSTDGTYITAIAGTDNGRIFMAGKDGCLYELVYQVNKSC
jgi:hypothetical protein